MAKLVASPPVSGGRRDQEGARPRRTHLTLKLKRPSVKCFLQLGESHTGEGDGLQEFGGERGDFAALTRRQGDMAETLLSSEGPDEHGKRVI